MGKLTRPALRYFGGKFQIREWIISHFPGHVTYCEPFGGGASVLLSKPKAKIEVYNDLNLMAVTFFRVLRSRPEELIQAIKLTPYARHEYILSQDAARADDDLERARMFYVWCWQGWGRGGVQESGGWRFMRSDSRGQTPCNDWVNIGHLYDVAERLRNVQLECVDALRCIDLYDTPETLFYVDPPYVPDTRGLKWRSSAYLHDYVDADHERLAEKLSQVQGMVVVSGYPSALYDRLFDGWDVRYKTSRKDDGLERRKKTTECLWISRNVKRQMTFRIDGGEG